MCATLRPYIFQNYTHNLNQIASKSCTEWNQYIEARYTDVLYVNGLWHLKQIFSWSEMTKLRNETKHKTFIEFLFTNNIFTRITIK